MIPEKQNLIPKIYSLLLQYPDEDFYAHLPALEELASGLGPGRQKDDVSDFFAGLRSRTRIAVQEDYTAAFDLNPATTLNMTYHLTADGEKRAGWLVQLQQAYGAAGYDRLASELPDYLPLILEFVSICPDARRIHAIGRCLAKMDHLAEALRKIHSPYAVLVQCLSAALKHPDAPGPDSSARAACDHQEGPSHAAASAAPAGGVRHEPCR